MLPRRSPPDRCPSGLVDPGAESLIGSWALCPTESYRLRLVVRVLQALNALPDHDRDESRAFNELGEHAEPLGDLSAGRIAAMDAQGIALSVLALRPPGTHPLQAVDAVRISRAANVLAVGAVLSNPSWSRALSRLPMSSPKGVVDELERAAGLGHVGTIVYGRAGDLSLDDPVYDDFFAAAARLGQPVFIHPQIPSRAVRDTSYRGFGAITDLALASFGWGWHMDAATAALRLIVRGTFARHPELHVVLGHWGEMLPFWADRAGILSRVAGLQRKASEYIRSNLIITASGMLNPAMLHHTLSVTPIDRFVFSTDYPFQRPTYEEMIAFTEHFGSDAERDAFISGNAISLFALENAFLSPNANT